MWKRKKRDAEELAALVAITDKLLGIVADHVRALALLIESHEHQRAKNHQHRRHGVTPTSGWYGQLPPNTRAH